MTTIELGTCSSFHCDIHQCVCNVDSTCFFEQFLPQNRDTLVCFASCSTIRSFLIKINSQFWHRCTIYLTSKKHNKGAYQIQFASHIELALIYDNQQMTLASEIFVLDPTQGSNQLFRVESRKMVYNKNLFVLVSAEQSS